MALTDDEKAAIVELARMQERTGYAAVFYEQTGNPLPADVASRELIETLLPPPEE